MLQKLLERLSRGEPYTTCSLAQELKVNEDLLEAMMADLARGGYLRPVENCEAGKCAGCNPNISCRPRMKTWVLGRKGS